MVKIYSCSCFYCRHELKKRVRKAVSKHYNTYSYSSMRTNVSLSQWIIGIITMINMAFNHRPWSGKVSREVLELTCTIVFMCAFLLLFFFGFI